MASEDLQPLILAIDQGTSSTRAIIFDQQDNVVASASREITLTYPANGWVEQDPLEIWQSTVEVCRQSLSKIDSVDRVCAIGITNQRETTIVWNRDSGQPVYNAIVWQDRRTAELCDALRKAGHEEQLSQKTGLLLDPYFSGTKVKWILDQVDDVRGQAEVGRLAFGTIDTWLVWNLTGGAHHLTDATNASRTMLFNIMEGGWDADILNLLDVPFGLLPEVQDSASDFGVTDKKLFGKEIPIRAIAGDQQAAAIGQACFEPGTVKSTYGTGCFALLNTGSERVTSSTKLLSTIGYRIKDQDTFALEGSIFMAGAIVQWLRDQLRVISHAADTAALAAEATVNHGVVLVPAFTGLGAPYWDPGARAALYGMTRDTGIPEIVAAALESVCFQTRDLLDSMDIDSKQLGDSLRVDGGMAANAWFLQRLSDTLGRHVECPANTETTALGVAYLAGLEAGLISSLQDIEKRWSCAQSFEPRMSADEREARYARWKDAVGRTLSVR